jgi:hypothetical protein
MNIENVIQVCGPLSQTPQNMPNGNKKGNGCPIIVVLLIGVIGYLIYAEWKRKKDIAQFKD